MVLSAKTVFIAISNVLVSLNETKFVGKMDGKCLERYFNMPFIKYRSENLPFHLSKNFPFDLVLSSDSLAYLSEVFFFFLCLSFLKKKKKTHCILSLIS